MWNIDLYKYNNFMKNRSHKREITYERGRVKEGSEEGEYG
jgi:hypothetical protein